MKNKMKLLFTILIFNFTQINAQVPVSKEPLHRPVLLNKYLRLLDVLLKPGDTTQYHFHATPSLFVHLSNTKLSAQIKGKEWIKEQSVSGKAWYNPFSPDILIHRVTNCDTVPFHVTDIEILSSYDTTHIYQNKPLPFTVLFENELSFAYKITNQNINQKITKSHGPLIAELATGTGILFHDLKTNKSKEIQAGQYLYIDPESSFYFSTSNTAEINMVLFEIK